MEFLEHIQIRARAHALGLACGEGVALRLPQLPVVYAGEYANGRRSGREPAAAADLVSRLGEWDECLVSITLWGVWPSSEDWPAFYAWRAARGERRSIQVAPGHEFARGESVLLT